MWRPLLSTFFVAEQVSLSPAQITPTPSPTNNGASFKGGCYEGLLLILAMLFNLAPSYYFRLFDPVAGEY
jgi:hypothetical protein